MQFLPSQISLLYYLLIINLFLIFAGYIIIKRKLVWIGWLLFILILLFVDQICISENAVFRMLAIISSMFICMKIIAGSESYKNTKCDLTVTQWGVFAIGWAGMRAKLFETLGKFRVAGASPMIWYGISRLIIGILMLLLAKQLLLLNINKQFLFYAVTIFLLLGYSFILHFGILSISAGLWRLFGVKTYLLFKSPLKSLSLSEFWSKRWNVAFSEMISIAIYRPLKLKLAPAAIVVISFIFSGLLHEFAISLPVRKGFGLPLLYFIIQAAGILLERYLQRKKIILSNKLAARIWLYIWVILPVPLLFHIYFIKGVVWPIMNFKAP